jgi:hypothetical protein
MNPALAPAVINSAAQDTTTTRLSGTAQPPSFEDARFPPVPAQPGEPDPVRIQLNGMANGVAQPEGCQSDGQPSEPPPEQADPAEPQSSFTSEARADGTLAIKGDPRALRDTLIAAGIPARSIARSKDGIMVGRNQSARVQEAISRMLQPEAADVSAADPSAIPVNMTVENQQMPMTPADQGGPDQVAPLMASADPTAPAGGVLPDQNQMASVSPEVNAVPDSPQSVAHNAASVSENPTFETQNAGTVTPDAAPIDVAAHDAATSPQNDWPEPSDLQKRAGNYKLGHERIAGMDLSIENPEGSVRRGADPDGKPWESAMTAHYGYVRCTTATDGDKLDVFVKPGTPSDFAGPVFVIDQVAPKTGHLDEHKTILGAADEQEAEAIYHSNYAADWNGMSSITRLPLPAFKAWAKSGDKKSPLGDLAAANQQGNYVRDPTLQTGAEAQAAADQTATAGSADAAGAGGPAPHPMLARIQRLKDAGEDQVAKLMQAGHDRSERLAAAPNELAAMRAAAPDLQHHAVPEFEQVYTQLREGGTKPAEAAARVGILAAVQSQGPAAGLSEKALEALHGQREKLPLDKAPAFAQRFTEALIEKGGRLRSLPAQIASGRCWRGRGMGPCRRWRRRLTGKPRAA